MSIVQMHTLTHRERKKQINSLPKNLFEVIEVGKDH